MRTDRRLPDFIGIGAQKSGTTWLDRVLRTHPLLHFPRWRKEAHFFDHHYSRGLDWYARFFPHSRTLDESDKVGETTPRYLFEPAVPERIKACLPDCQFWLILRDPVDRAFSHYRHERRTQGISVDFCTYLEGETEAFRRGLYAEQLERWFAHFPRDRFLILLFEEVMAAKEDALGKVAGFFGIPVSGFDLEIANSRVNEGRAMRFGTAYRALRAAGKRLRGVGLDAVVGIAKQLQLDQIFYQDSTDRLEMSMHLSATLRSRYLPSVERLEGLLERDLSMWKH